MKKKIVSMCLALSVLSMAVSGCAKEAKEGVIVRESDTDSEETATSELYLDDVTTTEVMSTEETIESSVEEESSETEVTESEETTVASLEEELAVDVGSLTEGELEARREQQLKFDEARQLLYELPNSKDKTEKIDQMDRQIIANNAYDFSNTNIVFIGDSITEGITSAVDTDGKFISYVTYVDSHLRFGRYLNHGKGGVMFSDYGGDDLSLSLDFSNIINIDSDIIVVFAGVNDYLSTIEGKRYGDINNVQSTAGYCGAVRYFMSQLQMYCGDKDVFFVTMYNVNRSAQSTYSDIATQPSLNDYLDVQRQLAKEYGFNVIELYNTGVMDCSDNESSDYYLRDGLHPKDNGNIVLGDHIAAELSLYYSQK